MDLIHLLNKTKQQLVVDKENYLKLGCPYDKVIKKFPIYFWHFESAKKISDVTYFSPISSNH